MPSMSISSSDQEHETWDNLRALADADVKVFWRSLGLPRDLVSKCIELFVQA